MSNGDKAWPGNVSAKGERQADTKGKRPDLMEIMPPNISGSMPPGKQSHTGLGAGEHRIAYQKVQRGRREAALKGKWPTPVPPRDLKQ